MQGEVERLRDLCTFGGQFVCVFYQSQTQIHSTSSIASFHISDISECLRTLDPHSSSRGLILGPSLQYDSLDLEAGWLESTHVMKTQTLCHFQLPTEFKNLQLTWTWTLWLWHWALTFMAVIVDGRPAVSHFAWVHNKCASVTPFDDNDRQEYLDPGPDVNPPKSIMDA